jgi:hypothetical protein
MRTYLYPEVEEVFMYLPPGRWRLVTITPMSVGYFNIIFSGPPDEPFPISIINAPAAIGMVADARWSTITGDISFITTAGLAFNGTLNGPRENYPITGPYVMSGMLRGPAGPSIWVADTYVVA